MGNELEKCGHSNSGAVCVLPKGHTGLHSAYEPPSAWSDDPPAEASPFGYWRRAHKDDQPRHVPVELFGDCLSFWDGDQWRDDFESFGGQWQPIAPPLP